MALDHLYRYHLMEWHQGRTHYPVPLHWDAQRRQTRRAADPGISYQRALGAYADYLESCDRQFIEGDEPEAVTRWLLEERTVLDLVEETAAVVMAGAPSPLARIGWAARNILQLMHRHKPWARLAGAGLTHARQQGDRRGEANCLESLGDLKLRVSDLEGARGDYQKALSLYGKIKDRLGEANCLKSLGDLKLRVSDLEGARGDYEKALPLFREINARLGEANCLKSLGLSLIHI